MNYTTEYEQRVQREQREQRVHQDVQQREVQQREVQQREVQQREVQLQRRGAERTYVGGDVSRLI